MQNPRLATRYAKALIDLSIEKGQLEQVFADMQWLQAVCKSNKDFVNLLRSPIIKPDVKKKIVEAVTTGSFINHPFSVERFVGEDDMSLSGRVSCPPRIAVEVSQLVLRREVPRLYACDAKHHKKQCKDCRDFLHFALLRR